MINIIICPNCGSTIGKKWFIFNKELYTLPKEKRDINNLELFKKLNITRQCCKIILRTATPDVFYREKLLESEFKLEDSKK